MRMAYERAYSAGVFLLHSIVHCFCLLGIPVMLFAPEETRGAINDRTVIASIGVAGLVTVIGPVLTFLCRRADCRRSGLPFLFTEAEMQEAQNREFDKLPDDWDPRVPSPFGKCLRAVAIVLFLVVGPASCIGLSFYANSTDHIGSEVWQIWSAPILIVIFAVSALPIVALHLYIMPINVGSLPIFLESCESKLSGTLFMALFFSFGIAQAAQLYEPDVWLALKAGGAIAFGGYGAIFFGMELRRHLREGPWPKSAKDRQS